MRLHRFIGAFDLTKNEVEITNPENIKQIKGVLRLELGDLLVLCDGIGKESEAQITEITKNSITCNIVKKLETKEPKNKVSLYLAILKKENFELAVQKAVECGVSEVIPIITERTIKTGLNYERLNKIILEASEQCGRTTLPTLTETLKFTDAIAYGGNSSVVSQRVIFDLSGSEYQPNKNAGDVSIFVGPEGGFSESEVAQAKSAGFAVASLGALTLRGETAAIVATYRTVQGI